LIRFALEAFVGLSVGKWLGYVKEPLNEAIHDHFLWGFARQTKRKKVLECLWRFSAYSFLFGLGCYVLHDKEWLYDIHLVFIGYPRHPIGRDIWWVHSTLYSTSLSRWYVMIESGFYISLLVGSAFDVRRSDFWEMFFHHVVTIGLLTFSWTVNFVRGGTLILLSHDISDIFLELAKLLRYSRKYTLLANTVFGVFLIRYPRGIRPYKILAGSSLV
jgi:ceramide synthetase